MRRGAELLASLATSLLQSVTSSSTTTKPNDSGDIVMGNGDSDPDRLPRLLASSHNSDADGKSLPKLVCLSKKCWRLQTLLTLNLTLPIHGLVQFIDQNSVCE